MNQCTHKAIIILFIMKLYIEFLVLLFSADDEKYKIRDGLTVVMKWVVIHGCFLCLGVLYCRRTGHPSLALHHLQDVSLLSAVHLRQPQIGCWGKTFRPAYGRKSLWKRVCGSLRGCNCYKNISISKAGRRQKVPRFDSLSDLQVCKGGRKYNLQMNDVA